MSVCNAGDITVTSLSHNKELYIHYSTPSSKDPPECKNTLTIAVMRGKPKDGYHCCHSNKHYKLTLVWVLLDSGSDGELVFVSKDKPMLLPTWKGWFHSRGILWMRSSRLSVRLGWSWTSLTTLIAKGTIHNSMWSGMRRIVSCSMTSFLPLKPWKRYVLCWTLNPRQYHHSSCQWETSTYCKGLAHSAC